MASGGCKTKLKEKSEVSRHGSVRFPVRVKVFTTTAHFMSLGQITAKNTHQKHKPTMPHLTFSGTSK